MSSMKNILIILHMLLQLVAFTSWLWIDYRIVAIFAAIHLLILMLLKGCPFSHAQFTKAADTKFYEWELGQLGIRLSETNRYRLRIFMQYVLPVIIITLALIVQKLAGVTPIIGM